jgi:hypothetical protein
MTSELSLQRFFTLIIPQIFYPPCLLFIIASVQSFASSHSELLTQVILQVLRD